MRTRKSKQKHLKILTARPSGKVRYHTKETIEKVNVVSDWDNVYYHTENSVNTKHKRNLRKDKNKVLSVIKAYLKDLNMYREAYFNLCSMIFLYQVNDTLEESVTVSEVQLEQVV